MNNFNSLKKCLFLIYIALVDYANTEISANNKTTTTTLSDKLKKHKNLDAIHCPTIDLPIKIDMSYSITSE